MSSALTPKQEKFTTAYIETGNASEAYRQSYDAAGMSTNSVHREAHALLENPKVAARLDELQAAHQKRHEATVDRLVKELSLIAFADAGEFFEWGPDGVTVRDKAVLTAEQRRVVSEVSQTVTEAGGTIRVKLHDKLAAIDKLGKHLGMFKDVHEHTGPDGGPIQIQRIERVIVDPADPDTESLPAPAGEPPVQGGKGRER